MKKILFALLAAGFLYACGGTPSKDRTDVLIIVGTGDVSDTAAFVRSYVDTVIDGCDDVSDVGMRIDKDIDLQARETFDTTLYRVCRHEKHLCFIAIKPSNRTVCFSIPRKGLYLWKQGSDWAYALHP